MSRWCVWIQHVTQHAVWQSCYLDSGLWTCRMNVGYASNDPFWVMILLLGVSYFCSVILWCTSLLCWLWVTLLRLRCVILVPKSFDLFLALSLMCQILIFILVPLCSINLDEYHFITINAHKTYFDMTRKCNASAVCVTWSVVESCCCWSCCISSWYRFKRWVALDTFSLVSNSIKQYPWNLGLPLASFGMRTNETGPTRSRKRAVIFSIVWYGLSNPS